jgi:hypothetical protein
VLLHSLTNAYHYNSTGVCQKKRKEKERINDTSKVQHFLLVYMVTCRVQGKYSRSLRKYLQKTLWNIGLLHEKPTKIKI